MSYDSANPAASERCDATDGTPALNVFVQKTSALIPQVGSQGKGVNTRRVQTIRTKDSRRFRRNWIRYFRLSRATIMAIHLSARILPPNLQMSLSVSLASSAPMSHAYSPASRTHNHNRALLSELEYEGESSLSAHAGFATRFVQEIINNSDSACSSTEMAMSLNALRQTIEANQVSGDTFRDSYPHADIPSPRSCCSNLSMPPIQSALVCLRVLRECPRIKFFWFLEFQSIDQFTEYVLTAYASEDASIADLIIVNAGLHLLFVECGNVAASEALKTEYQNHSHLCRNNLETLLSSLPFNLPSTKDVTLALCLAASYLLDRCRPSAAWNFITAASHMSQVLGFHRASLSVGESTETKSQKTRLFWVIYITEKSLSLRLGRPSTIRNSDVTVPLTDQCSLSDGLASPIMTKWIRGAQLQGNVYDSIYSPSALEQRGDIRAARAKALVADAHKLQDSESAADIRYMESRHHLLGDSLHELLLRTQQVSHLSLLTLIYRSVPASQMLGNAFSEKCIATAREALEEHGRCISILSQQADSVFELYINWALLSSPFVPFTVLFCYVVQTSNPTDLHYLGAVVETLQSVPPSFSDSCSKQLRLFKILYDVACKYVQIKVSSRSNRSGDSFDAVDGEGELANAFHLGRIGIPGSNEGDPDPIARATNIHEPTTDGFETLQMGQESIPVMDSEGAQLGDWFYQNYQMFGLLEHSSF
ncbi:fungal specific transcription factor [Colletotrichum tofieldiae]|uniref:Fungal specific transcription factor n=1 Tax=Colletotrichum tofieldiae TaxID=708197 RepID=A0A166XMQ8_9PEZI|nr:fungal specific transcription factor [Colletotrichum tofieldiae]